ncbi:hypothetical protein BC832DRAFT_622923 [Gaertneriomyces semiglobifer]|nr:hypothetical protein BC832DRAFT_622923 [Gaertneriomyces semiglobifer]
MLAAANRMVDGVEPGVMGSAGDASSTRLDYDFDKYRMPDDETEKSDGEDDGIEKSLKAYVLKKMKPGMFDLFGSSRSLTQCGLLAEQLIIPTVSAAERLPSRSRQPIAEEIKVIATFIVNV